MKLRYFALEEFASPDLPGSGEQMKHGILTMLDKARDIANVPFVITSGYRTVEHNHMVGGVDNSAHVGGYAADIRYAGEAMAVTIIAALTLAGFRRIGKGKTFIHADDDPSKRAAYWDYSQADHMA